MTDHKHSITPEKLVKYYARFNVNERILLTGHSHQAWPDCSLAGQIKAWNDAATFVDNKWPLAFQKAEQVRQWFLKLLDDDNGYLTLGQNTHELVVRFLSALPLKKRPQILTTDGEFHSIRRQLNRLEEESIEIIRIPSQSVDDVIPMLIKNLSVKTAAVMVSSVFFHNAQILSRFDDLMQACENNGTELLIDVYHQLNVVPFSVQQNNLQNAFIIGGGYKYCQFGEGVCFLRFPKQCQMRPVITGWFADYAHLDTISEVVAYDDEHNRFAGATFDPVSFYRAVEVLEFFKKNKLTPTLLRELSQKQINHMANRFDDFDLDPAIISRDKNISLEKIAGFLSLRTQHAKPISDYLLKNDVYTDFRGDYLRLGPAPYVTFEQIDTALNHLKDACSKI